MKINMRLDHISCIIPRKKEERIISEIIYTDRTRTTVSVRPETVIQWVADRNYINLKLVRRLSQELNYQRKGAPLPLGMHDVFLPIHLVEEMRKGYACYGFCNAAEQDADVLPVPGERRQSLLRYRNGTELLVDLKPDHLSKCLSMAVATHRRFIRKITVEGYPLCASRYGIA